MRRRCPVDAAGRAAGRGGPARRARRWTRASARSWRVSALRFTASPRSLIAVLVPRRARRRAAAHRRRCSSATPRSPQVRFEFGEATSVPEQLVVVPMLLLLPAAVRAAARRGRRRARGSSRTSSRAAGTGTAGSTASRTRGPTLGPVLSSPPSPPGRPSCRRHPVYVARARGPARHRLRAGRRSATALLDRVPVREARADLRRGDSRRAGPLPGRLRRDARGVRGAARARRRDRTAGLAARHLLAATARERYAAALELNRAYRGTVMLLVRRDRVRGRVHGRSIPARSSTS